MLNLKKIVLHVGIPKTASTAIQRTLRINHIFRSAKYYLPESLSIFNIVSMFSDNLHTINSPELIVQRLREEHSRVKISHIKNKLYDELKRNSPETLIISSEYISSMFFSKHALLELRDFLLQLSGINKVELQVFAYVRNPLDFQASGIQQLVRWGETYELTDIHFKFYQSVYFNLKVISEVFGRNNTYIYKYEDAIQYKYGAVGLFLSTMLNLTDKEIDKIQKAEGINKSAPHIAIDICNFINQCVTSIKNKTLKQTSLDSLDTICQYVISGKKFALSKQQKYKYLPYAIESNNLLKEHFNIEYSLSDMLFSIESNSDPEVVLMNENLLEIKNIYNKIHPEIRNYVVDYLKQYHADVIEKYVF